MKKRQRLMAMLTAAFILSGGLPVAASEADQIPEETTAKQETVEVHDEEITDDESLSGTTTLSGNEAESTAEDNMADAPQRETSGTAEEKPYETNLPVPDEAPAFQARIEFRQGYTVIGTFKDFTPDINLVQTLYSLDGENWQIGVVEWNLFNLSTDEEDELYVLQNQPCVYDRYEPLKSYIDGKIDRFYLKLRITKNNGLSYETQAAIIERGGLQPIPEGTERYAFFSSAIAVSEPDPASPYRYRRYGRYQLTIPAGATAKEVSALLPDTLPVEVQLNQRPNFVAKSVVDCPVTWKPLSLPPLSPGESITISDAAEEILVPSGTLVPTPVGTFQLDEPLSLNTPPYTDEVNLVLNVSSEDRNPTGVLRSGKDGLEMAFHIKPTGAASIQSYVLAEGEAKWTELSDLLLQEELNQPSTANSGYALVLRNDQEPYRSYLAAIDAGETPAPFFVGLKIAGGVYDGRQLILAWPDDYEQLPELPELGGAGGNEGNAGADNKKDSTESGQRPNLPQAPEDDKEKQQPNPTQVLGNSKEEQRSNPAAPKDEKQASRLIPNLPAPVYQAPAVSESGQRPNLPWAMQDTSDTSSVKTFDPANQKNSHTIDWLINSIQPSLVVQAAADITNEESAVTLSNAETAMGHSTEGNDHVPLLPVTAAIMAIICIAIAVRRRAG